MRATSPSFSTFSRSMSSAFASSSGSVSRGIVTVCAATPACACAPSCAAAQPCAFPFPAQGRIGKRPCIRCLGRFSCRGWIQSQHQKGLGSSCRRPILSGAGPDRARLQLRFLLCSPMRGHPYRRPLQSPETYEDNAKPPPPCSLYDASKPMHCPASPGVQSNASPARKFLCLCLWLSSHRPGFHLWQRGGMTTKMNLSRRAVLPGVAHPDFQCVSSDSV